MRIARSLWRVETVTFAIVFAWLMTVGPKSLLRDPGPFWHIRVGERILEAGEAIRTDPFSAAFTGQPWVPVGWLSEVVLALLHRVDGFDTVLLATAATLAGLFAWMARRLSAAGLQWPIVALLLTLCVAASSYHFHPRPHLATMVLFACTFALLDDVEARRVPMRRLLCLPAIVALWTNLHGGVVGGLATVALCGAGWTVSALVRHSSPIATFADFARLALLGLACLGAVLVNPYGIELPWLWFTLLDSPVLSQLIIEHAPLSLADASGRLVAGLGLLYGACLVGVPLRSLRVTWLVPLVWFALTLSRVRNGPLFALSATLAIAAMYADVRWIRWLTEHGSDLLRLRGAVERESYSHGGLRAAIVPALMVGACLLLQVARAPVPVFGHGWARLDPGYWPVELLPELQAFERERADGAPIFNEMRFGGFLIYHTPGLRVFIDDRCELYGDARLQEYRRAINGETAIFEDWARQYRFERALSIPDSAFDRYLRESSSWEVVRETEPAVLYRRRPDG